MNLVVFGGTGGTGKQIIMQALGSGHRITAIVRRPEAVELRHEQLTLHQGDVLDPASFAPILSGHEVVLSVLGTGTSRHPTTLYSEGTRNIVQAMETAGVQRFVGVTASGFVADPKDGLLLAFVIKPLVSRILKHPYADMKRMEAALQGSALEWTVLRPARLTNGPQRGHYRTVVGGTGNVPGGMKISRADVADLMLKQLETSKTVRKAVGIAY